MLEHGGRLRQAAHQHGIALHEWLDLSTGINPDTWPVPPLDPRCWNRLPEDDDGLEEAAAAYYGNPRLLPLAGSQAAIQTLPQLFERATIACVSPLYEEHPHAWERCGHALRRLPSLQRALTAATTIVLLCNPNNPTARAIPRDELLVAADTLHRRGGWLIIDEAFADAEAENSLTELAGSDALPRLIVLRSLGKFFGLAGARVGFLFAASGIRDALREKLGPWPISHPAREVARMALEDSVWQQVPACSCLLPHSVWPPCLLRWVKSSARRSSARSEHLALRLWPNTSPATPSCCAALMSTACCVSACQATRPNGNGWRLPLEWQRTDRCSVVLALSASDGRW